MVEWAEKNGITFKRNKSKAIYLGNRNQIYRHKIE